MAFAYLISKRWLDERKASLEWLKPGEDRDAAIAAYNEVRAEYEACVAVLRALDGPDNVVNALLSGGYMWADFAGLKLSRDGERVLRDYDPAAHSKPAA